MKFGGVTGRSTTTADIEQPATTTTAAPETTQYSSQPTALPSHSQPTVVQQQYTGA